MVVYVNDILLAAKNEDCQVQNSIQIQGQRFWTSGIDPGHRHLAQLLRRCSVLECFGMAECSPAKTPLSIKDIMSKDYADPADNEVVPQKELGGHMVSYQAIV